MFRSNSHRAILVFSLLLLIFRSQADNRIDWSQYRFTYNQTESQIQSTSPLHQFSIHSRAGAEANQLSLVFDSSVELESKSDGVTATVSYLQNGLCQVTFKVARSAKQQDRSVKLTGQAELIGLVEDDQQEKVFRFDQSIPSHRNSKKRPLHSGATGHTKSDHQFTYQAPPRERSPLYQEQANWLGSPVDQDIMVFMMNQDPPPPERRGPDRSQSSTSNNSGHESGPDEEGGDPDEEPGDEEQNNDLALLPIHPPHDALALYMPEAIPGFPPVFIFQWNVLLFGKASFGFGGQSTTVQLTFRGISFGFAYLLSAQRRAIALFLTISTSQIRGVELIMREESYTHAGGSCAEESQNQERRGSGNDDDDNPPPPMAGAGDGIPGTTFTCSFF